MKAAFFWGADLANILGYELNGGTKKLLIGTGLTIATGFGGYVMNASSKVEPLVEKTLSIEKQIDTHRLTVREHWVDQKEWNALFLSEQKDTNAKIDQLLEMSRNKP